LVSRACTVSIREIGTASIGTASIGVSRSIATRATTLRIANDIACAIAATTASVAISVEVV
jgi:hypothetical protein